MCMQNEIEIGIKISFMQFDAKSIILILTREIESDFIFKSYKKLYVVKHILVFPFALYYIYLRKISM